MRLVIIVLMVTATPHYTKILALAQERWGQIYGYKKFCFKIFHLGLTCCFRSRGSRKSLSAVRVWVDWLLFSIIFNTLFHLV